MKKFKKVLAMLLVLSMLAGYLPANTMTVEATGESSGSEVVDAAIIFTDLHTSQNDYKESTIQGIFESLKDTELPFSSVNSGGDAFSVNEESSSSNGPYTGDTKTISNSIRNYLGDSSIPVNYTWSDHDRYALQEDGDTFLDKTSHLTYGAGQDGVYGTDDDGNYYVYALSMGDLCSYDRYCAGFNSYARVGAGFTETIDKAIENFNADAAKLKKDRPLFIVSHQPLFDRRNDNAFAEQWFDAINKVAEDMDVAFFFGHNHKYDQAEDYYYAKGSQMPVATNERWQGYETGAGYWGYLPTGDLAAKSKTLNFTHMCAGYMDPSSTGSTSNTTREGTVVVAAIYEDSIQYSTYNKDGLYTNGYGKDVNVKRDHAIVSDSSGDSSDTPVIPDTPVTPEAPGNVTREDTETKTTVTAPGIIDITVTKTSENPDPGLYKAYAKYNINLNGYTQGDEATVSIKLDNSFSENGQVMVFDVEKSTSATYNVTNRVVTFKTNHFSEYAVAEINESAVKTVEGALKTTTVQITTKDELVDNQAYVLVSNTGNATLTTIIKKYNQYNRFELSKDNQNDINLNYLWYYDKETGGLYCKNTSGKQWMNISHQSASLSTERTVDSIISVKGSVDNTFTISNGNNVYLNKEGNANGGYSTGAHGYKDNNQPDPNSNWRIYKVVQSPVTLSVDPSSLSLYLTSEINKVQLNPVVNVNGSTASRYSISYSSGDQQVVTVSETGEVTSVAVGNTTIKVTLSKANGVDLENPISINIPVTVSAAEIKSVTINNNTGTVAYNSNNTTKTGSKLTVTYSDGESQVVDVTVDMLSGQFNLSQAGTYTELTVNYNGYRVENYTLVVLEPSNYPEYPHEGAVKVNKTGTGIDFQSSGIAQVEVSASGVPVKKGADLIIMLDTSSSMTKNMVTSTNKKRSEVLEESLANLITQLKKPGDDGELLDINVAIADFNGYYGDGSGGTSGTPYDRTSGDYVKNGNDNGSGYGQPSKAQVYTGKKALDADAFVSVENLQDTYTLNYTSGTNYDYAFDAIYQLGTAIKAANTEERDLYVIFMSDGASLQWNYFGTQNTYTKWNDWLAGKWTADDLTTTNLNSTAHSYFYDLNDHDGDGHINEHRMANAIKGDPESQYEVIRKSTAGLPEGTLRDVQGKQYLYTVPGLGATMFTINFDAQKDGQITVDSIDKALASTASDQTGTTKYYYKVTTADELSHAFDVIGSEIAYAASNARFVDQMGDDYNLQMKTSNYTVVNGTSKENKKLDPKIEIISYDIYTKADAEAGKISEGKHIGDRKDTSKILETVTFNADGTEAYSDQIGNGKTNILADGTQEGYVKGVIYAKTFLYNTNVADVAVTGVNIPTGTNEDGTTSGSTNVLPSETFYWKMGTVQTSELAMRYYVYLEGSMEGTKPAGSYPTNEYANLYYDNYLGNPCQKPTVSPVLAWKEANVSYAFYLVDENGNPIVNQTTGQTGTFANKIAVTNPVVYKTVTLNSSQELEADVVAKNVLPEGYTLYDTDYDDNGNLTDGAAYEVKINSNSTGSWIITSKKEKATTYVTQYNPNNASAYSNEKAMNTVGNDYTHTVVWFAVVWSIQAIPDTVVIDYGLPVDISVLSNDMFGENGKLAAVGANRTESSECTSALAEGFTNKYIGTYGTAEANTTTGKVRYTPSTMEMNGYEKFAYAVNYTGTGNVGYYYDTVTVIPATTIYYEDDFVKYNSYTWDYTTNQWKEKEDSLWDTAGTRTAGAIQGEDRPGKYSLADANNIYGYDSVNRGMSTYSLGSAMKATVNYDNYAQASFTFYGTGFDIISMTSNMTGTILVDVERKDGDIWKEFDNFAVDTYYGYKQVAGDADKDGTEEENEMIWVVDPDSTDSLYQVPVIKMVDKEYGQYRVTIKATYDAFFDHVNPSNEIGNYDFYLDAIRIYDPANDGAVDSDQVIEEAYKADGEGWPSYIELRNKLIQANSFDNVENDKLTTDMDGLVFIDGDDSVGDAQLADYINYGPNNEVYLKPGQRVAFMVDAPANLANIRIGIKSADGQPATYTITNIAKENIADGKVMAGDWYNARTSTVDTATDMYYDLTAWKGDIIVISNTGNNITSTGDQSNEGIISLTNIKSTYTSAPTTVTPSAKAITNKETSIYMTAEAAALTLRTLNTPAEDDKEEVEAKAEVLSITTDKESYTNLDTVTATVKTNEAAKYVTVNGNKITECKEEAGARIWTYSVKVSKVGTFTIKAVAYNEEEASEEMMKFIDVKRFEPETFKLALDKKIVIVGEKVKATVTTSTDVKYVTINGKKVTKYTGNEENGTRTWALDVKAAKVGKMTFKAVAYNTNGSASKTIFEIATGKQFMPKTFIITLSKSTVKKGQKYTVTVITSSDVKYVTVNGEKIYTSNKSKIFRTFKVTYTDTTIGNKTIKVIAYDKNGLASKPKTKTVTVNKK